MPAVEVIGIDPGSVRTGWGIVREMSGVLQLVDCGIIRSSRESLNTDESGFSSRLAGIYTNLCAVLGHYMPDSAAIEQVFTARNAQSALKLGQARGVAVAACAAYGLQVADYEPTLVKKSLVGNGRAEKEQVAFMVKRLLNVKNAAWPLDTTDALAVAICHLGRRRFDQLARKTGSAGECA